MIKKDKYGYVDDSYADSEEDLKPIETDIYVMDKSHNISFVMKVRPNPIHFTRMSRASMWSSLEIFLEAVRNRLSNIQKINYEDGIHIILSPPEYSMAYIIPYELYINVRASKNFKNLFVVKSFNETYDSVTWASGSNFHVYIDTVYDKSIQEIMNECKNEDKYAFFIDINKVEMLSMEQMKEWLHDYEDDSGNYHVSLFRER